MRVNKLNHISITSDAVLLIDDVSILTELPCQVKLKIKMKCVSILKMNNISTISATTTQSPVF